MAPAHRPPRATARQEVRGHAIRKWREGESGRADPEMISGNPGDDPGIRNDPEREHGGPSPPPAREAYMFALLLLVLLIVYFDTTNSTNSNNTYICASCQIQLGQLIKAIGRGLSMSRDPLQDPGSGMIRNDPWIRERYGGIGRGGKEARRSEVMPSGNGERESPGERIRK